MPTTWSLHLPLSQTVPFLYPSHPLERDVPYERPPKGSVCLAYTMPQINFSTLINKSPSSPEQLLSARWFIPSFFALLCHPALPTFHFPSSFFLPSAALPYPFSSNSRSLLPLTIHIPSTSTSIGYSLSILFRSSSPPYSPYPIKHLPGTCSIVVVQTSSHSIVVPSNEVGGFA